MSREEASNILNWMKWHFADMGTFCLAGQIEDSQRIVDHGSIEDIRAYASYVLPPGYKGRVRLILESPYKARAIATLYGILRIIEA